MAALLSALMSSLTSNFNSSATLFTMDMYRPCRPKAKEKELMIVSRLWTVVLAGISIAWIPILGVVQGAKFWDYIQSIASYLLPPVVMVFYFGIFWKRTTEVVRIRGDLRPGFVVDDKMMLSVMMMMMIACRCF